jgi:hypothetical protein
METSGVLDNSIFLRLRKVTAMRQLKAGHSQSKPPSPKYSRKYRGKTKRGLDKRGNKRSDMMLYVLHTAFYGKLQENV